MQTQWHIEHRMPDQPLLGNWYVLNDPSTPSGKCVYDHEAEAREKQAVALKAFAEEIRSHGSEIRLLRVTSEVVG